MVGIHYIYDKKNSAFQRAKWEQNLDPTAVIFYEFIYQVLVNSDYCSG